MEYWDRERLGCQDRERRDGLENSYQNHHHHHHLHHHQLILASAVPMVVVEGSLTLITDVEMVEMEVGIGHECLVGYSGKRGGGVKCGWYDLMFERTFCYTHFDHREKMPC